MRCSWVWSATIIRLIAFMAMLALHGVAGPAFAQPDDRARLDGIKAELAQIDAAAQERDMSDAALQALRARIDPIQDELRAIIARQTPRLAAAKSRLDQLGPKPEAGKGSPEGTDVAKERDDQEKQRAESDDILRLARLMSVQGTQLQSAIAERRLTSFAREVFRRSSSIVSPLLWGDAIGSLPREGQALAQFFRNARSSLAAGPDRTQLTVLLATVLLIAAIAFPFRRLIWRLDSRDPGVLDPPKRRRAIAALRIVTVRVAAAALFVGICSGALELFDLPSGLRGVITALFWGIAVIFAIRGLAKAVLAPEAPGWRLFGDNEISVRHLSELAITVPSALVIGRVLDVLNQAIAARLTVTVLTKGLFAAIVAALIVQALRKMQEVPVTALDEVEDRNASLQPAVPTRVPFRLLLGAAAFAILAADLLGYIALAAYLADQVVWAVCVGTLLALCVILIDEVIGEALSSRGHFGAFVQSTIGIEAGSVEQVAVLFTGVMRVVVWIAAIFLVLAPWGVDGNDAFSALRAAFFGFSIGGITISLSVVAAALGTFIATVIITRAMQRWLETRYLPITGLDLGLRNSILTIFGYIGVLLAAVLALAQLGFSLERLTLIAGALSLGIGFGLQSIVNNFVSGLILLWERPIRVGDWIVVGADQGIVKRINVRATEIETFDRASLIVPNAEFISGRVKNWMHNDRLGRILIPLGVAYGADPEHVRKTLLDVALGHREVLSEPKPRVTFVKFGESSIDFELCCYCDIDSMGSVKSDLLFEIFKRMKDESIDIPFPHRTVQIAGIERLVEQIGGKPGTSDKPGKADDPSSSSN